MHGTEYLSSEHANAKTRFWVLYLAAIIVGLFLVFIDRIDGILYKADIDDVLRGLQIKTLLATGNWFDRTLPFIEMPEAYVSPWSRLVDLPYVVIAWLLSPLMPAEVALKMAFYVWPPIMLAVYCILVVEIQKRILPAGENLAISILILSLVLMGTALWEFTPERIDHHNMQLVLNLLLFFGLALWDRVGGFVAAFAIVLSVAVGLELVPLAALILVAVCLSWALSRNGAAVFLHNLGIGIVVFTPISAVLLLGPAGIRQTACDTFSAPYISALVGFGVIAVGIPLLQSKASAWARILGLGVTGSILLGGLAASFPLCLSGPYHMIDPISRELWLNRIPQELSILSLITEGSFTALINLVVFAIIASLAAPLVWQQWTKGATGVAIIFAGSVFCLILTCLQTRYTVYPTAFIPLFVPLMLFYVRRAPSNAFRVLIGVICVVAVSAFSFRLGFSNDVIKADAADYAMRIDCKSPDIAALDISILNGMPKGRIMAPTTLGLFMANQLPPGMTVAGVSFHRGSPAIKRIMETFILPDAVARKAALLPFDYVAVCRLNLPETLPNDTLYAKLTRGGKWPGLDVIETAATSGFRLFKIDHAKLQ